MSPYVDEVVEKDPSADLPYEIDWTKWLSALGPSVTLVTSEWIITVIAGTNETPLTHDNPAFIPGNKITQTWLHGGTPATSYRVTNRVTATGSPTPKDDKSFFVNVKER